MRKIAILLGVLIITSCGTSDQDEVQSSVDSTIESSVSPDTAVIGDTTTTASDTSMVDSSASM